ncbi:DUF3012 domain-containing protein [Vibrio sonorensis]|uniref:DUF3012 domain-containing protein n=1 Tax=Vibrio sonorensis TaxID=1004316 RepID=UPI000A06983F|nr:DUF3012 domain-containing protein [Vibrio sonorensis]
MKKLALLSLISFVLIGCTEVGSEAWCEDMKETPKGEWTLDDTKGFAKHCIL